MNAAEAAVRLQRAAARQRSGFTDAIYATRPADEVVDRQRDSAALYAAAREAYWCATEWPGHPMDFGGGAVNHLLARRRFISRLASAWDAALDLDPADVDESTRHAIWVIGQTVDRLDPGRTDEIVERRAGRQS